MDQLAVGFGEPVLDREALDPREDRLGLYLWGTVGWHRLILVGTAVLMLGAGAWLPGG